MVSEDQPKAKWAKFRIDEETLDVCDRAAARAKLPVSAWMRTTLFAAAIEQLELVPIQKQPKKAHPAKPKK